MSIASQNTLVNPVKARMRVGEVALGLGELVSQAGVLHEVAAVAGGRVIADWPGLASRDLHDGRDLRATTDLRALFKGVLHERFGVTEAALARAVFPGSGSVEPLEGVTVA